MQVTLMNWGNCIMRKVHKGASGHIEGIDAELHLEGDFKKTKYKLTWLADVPDLVPLRLVDLGHLITKPKVRPHLPAAIDVAASATASFSAERRCCAMQRCVQSIVCWLNAVPTLRSAMCTTMSQWCTLTLLAHTSCLRACCTRHVLD